MLNLQAKLFLALHDDGKQACTAPGGFFVRGEGFVSTAALKRRYGIVSEPRTKQERIGAYGDYAIVAMLNGIKA